MNTPGLIIAAPGSGSGKTTLTLGLLRALRQRGVKTASAKVGPDYIDPGFHRAASGRACYNLDGWAMRPATLAANLRRCAASAELIVAEGVMGLFDGANTGAGSTADLAELNGWPVVLVIDAGGMAASAAAVAHGFNSYRPGLRLAGLVFNRVGSPAHARLLAEACAPLDIALLGSLPRVSDIRLPERHLGLVQAEEHPALEEFIDRAAALIGEHLNLDALIALARPATLNAAPALELPPLGQRIAVANDRAFAFCYPHTLDNWRAAGAEILPFSPLADQPPAGHADAVYLPGGYPELHAARLAANRRFLGGLRAAARRGAVVYGECGGYMTLGRHLTDADGRVHTMAGLLPVSTSFAQPKLQLGYRRLTLCAAGPWGPAGAGWRGHEFHFARLTEDFGGEPLFRAGDAGGRDLGAVGNRCGSVSGSFVHLIDREFVGR